MIFTALRLEAFHCLEVQFIKCSNRCILLVLIDPVAMADNTESFLIGHVCIDMSKAVISDIPLNQLYPFGRKLKSVQRFVIFSDSA